MNDSKLRASADLGSGSVGKLIVRLALPSIIAQVVNLLYNLVDRIYIGHIPEVGDMALTGLGLCLPVIMIVTAFSLLIGAGGAPRASIAMGKGDTALAEKILGNCTFLLIITAIVLSVILEIFAEPILIMFGASNNTLPYALDYARIYLAGNIFVMTALGLNTFITAQGFAKISMASVIIGAVLNIALDPLFIFGFNMGVRGAALATIISQAASAIWVICFLCGKKTHLRIRKCNFRLSARVVGSVLALGVSPFIMTATESILNIVFNSSLAKYGDDIAVGAMTILASIMQLMMMPTQGLAQGTQPVVSYNYGAGKIDRVKKAYRILFISCFAYTLIFWIILQLVPEFFVQLFNSESEQLLRTTVWALRIYLGAMGFFGIQMAAQQTFVALGQAKISLFIASLRKLILLIPLIYILPHFLPDKVFAVFLAEPIADAISIIAAGSLFFFNIKKILSKAPSQPLSQ